MKRLSFLIAAVLIFPTWCPISLLAAPVATPATAATAKSADVSVNGDNPWIDTGMDVKAGDKVLYGKYSGSEIKLDDEEYLIMHQDDILGILK